MHPWRHRSGLYAKDGNSSTAHFSAYTVTTNGIQITRVACPPLGSKIPFRSLMLRCVSYNQRYWESLPIGQLPMVV